MLRPALIDATGVAILRCLIGIAAVVAASSHCFREIEPRATRPSMLLSKEQINKRLTAESTRPSR